MSGLVAFFRNELLALLFLISGKEKIKLAIVFITVKK
jgi:hypothetical protein